MLNHKILLITALSMLSLHHTHITAMSIRKQMSDAIQGTDAKRVRSLLDEHGDKKEIYAADDEGNTLLHEACKMLNNAHNGKDSIISIVDQLLKICSYDFKKYDVNAKNRDDNTPFHYVNEGLLCPENCIVEWFFQKRAKPNIQNKEGNSPFHHLLQGKIDPNKREGGCSAATIKLFLNNGANSNLPNNDGYTPFHYICQQDDFTLIRLFLDGDADPNTQTKHSHNTPFHFICHNIAEEKFHVNAIEQFFQRDADRRANPNIQNREGNTPYHHIARGIYRPDVIELFLTYGARGDIPNNAGEIPDALKLENENEYKNGFRAIHNKNLEWDTVQDHPYWEKYPEYLSKFIKQTFRYCASDVPRDDFIINDQNIITMVTIHDINDQENPDYYDTANVQFKGIMKFAEDYIKAYNQKKMDKMHNEKKKILHLISFSWQNNIISSAEKLSKYLDGAYRNSRLIFLAPGFGCDVANLTSHRVGYLQINKAIKEENDGMVNPDKEKLHKGRIRLLMYFLPICRHKIPQVKKSLSIDLLGREYDELNDSIATTPTNYDLMLNFYSPNDTKIKDDAFTHQMKSFAITTIFAGIFGGGIVAQASNTDNVRDNVLRTIIGAGTGILYPGLTAYNKKKTISRLVRHRYENVSPISEPNGDSFTIEGPKVHLETKVNKKYIGHSVPELSQHLSIIYKILKTQYFTELAQSRGFCININTEHNVHTLSEYLKENESKLHIVERSVAGKVIKDKYMFNDNGMKSTIEDEFKFWNNCADNCKVQCWFDNEPLPLDTEDNRYFYWARITKKVGTDDRDQLITQAKRTQVSHKRLFEYIDTLQ